MKNRVFFVELICLLGIILCSYPSDWKKEDGVAHRTVFF